MKQLIDWPSNPHLTPDTGMLTYPLLSNGTQANGDYSCLVLRCFDEFTSHQLYLRRPTEYANLALKTERSARVTPGAPILRCSSAAATPTKWQPAPATRVTLLLPGKECE